jgi:hypothetical protein
MEQRLIVEPTIDDMLEQQRLAVKRANAAYKDAVKAKCLNCLRFLDPDPEVAGYQSCGQDPTADCELVAADGRRIVEAEIAASLNAAAEEIRRNTKRAEVNNVEGGFEALREYAESRKGRKGKTYASLGDFMQKVFPERFKKCFEEESTWEKQERIKKFMDELEKEQEEGDDDIA